MQECRPTASDLDVGLVDKPPVTGSVPSRPSGVDELRRERLHPPVDSHVIDRNAAFGQQFLDVAVGQAVRRYSAPPTRSPHAGSDSRLEPTSQTSNQSPTSVRTEASPNATQPVDASAKQNLWRQDVSGFDRAAITAALQPGRAHTIRLDMDGITDCDCGPE
jgi:hypothetical protein